MRTMCELSDDLILCINSDIYYTESILKFLKYPYKFSFNCKDILGKSNYIILKSDSVEKRFI